MFIIIGMFSVGRWRNQRSRDCSLTERIKYKALLHDRNGGNGGFEIVVLLNEYTMHYVTCESICIVILLLGL